MLPATLLKSRLTKSEFQIAIGPQVVLDEVAGGGCNSGSVQIGHASTAGRRGRGKYIYYPSGLSRTPVDAVAGRGPAPLEAASDDGDGWSR